MLCDGQEISRFVTAPKENVKRIVAFPPYGGQ
jgi:hypothetical protein